MQSKKWWSYAINIFLKEYEHIYIYTLLCNGVTSGLFNTSSGQTDGKKKKWTDEKQNKKLKLYNSHERQVSLTYIKSAF